MRVSNKTSQVLLKFYRIKEKAVTELQKFEFRQNRTGSLSLPDYFSSEYRCVIRWRPFVSTGSDPTQLAGQNQQRTRTRNRPIRMTHRRTRECGASVRNKRHALPRWCVPHAKVDKNSWYIRRVKATRRQANFHAARRSALPLEGLPGRSPWELPPWSLQGCTSSREDYQSWSSCRGHAQWQYIRIIEFSVSFITGYTISRSD